MAIQGFTLYYAYISLYFGRSSSYLRGGSPSGFRPFGTGLRPPTVPPNADFGQEPAHRGNLRLGVALYRVYIKLYGATRTVKETVHVKRNLASVPSRPFASLISGHLGTLANAKQNQVLTTKGIPPHPIYHVGVI